MSAKRDLDTNLSPCHKKRKPSAESSCSYHSPHRSEYRHRCENSQVAFSTLDSGNYKPANSNLWQSMASPRENSSYQDVTTGLDIQGRVSQERMLNHDLHTSYNTLTRPELWRPFDFANVPTGYSMVLGTKNATTEDQGNFCCPSFDGQSPPSSSQVSAMFSSTTSFDSNSFTSSRDFRTTTSFDFAAMDDQRADDSHVMSSSEFDTVLCAEKYNNYASGETTPQNILAIIESLPAGAKESQTEVISFQDKFDNRETSTTRVIFSQLPTMAFTKSFDHGEPSDSKDPGGFANVEWQSALTSPEGSQEKIGRQKIKGAQKQKKPGQRNGPLTPEAAKRTADTRMRRACWSCWLLKIPCLMSPDAQHCHHCRSTKTGLFSGIICSRRQLAEYAGLFFPAELVSHLQETSIKVMIEDNVLEFSNTVFKVHVSSGHSYQPMELSLRQFSLKSEEFLAVDRVEEDLEGRTVTVRRYASPLGLRAQDVMLLKKKCSQHIESIVARGWSLQNSGPFELSSLSSKILVALDRFWRLSTIPATRSTVKDVCTLYEMHNFMGRSLTIIGTEEQKELFKPSKEKWQQSQLDIDLDLEVPSRLLNRQIKYVMHELLQDTTVKVLVRLEKEMKTKSKTFWASSFCTILLLCICVEEVQIAIDGFSVYCHSQPERINPLSRDAGLGLARQLDDRLIADCKTLFHSIHKTHKGPRGSKNEKSFNPIRDPFVVDDKEPWTKELHDLVEAVHEILGTYGPDVTERAETPSFSDADDLLESHMEFRSRNSGRLVARFLRSFLDASN